MISTTDFSSGEDSLAFDWSVQRSLSASKRRFKAGVNSTYDFQPSLETIERRFKPSPSPSTSTNLEGTIQKELALNNHLEYRVRETILSESDTKTNSEIIREMNRRNRLLKELTTKLSSLPSTTEMPRRFNEFDVLSGTESFLDFDEGTATFAQLEDDKWLMDDDDDYVKFGLEFTPIRSFSKLETVPASVEPSLGSIYTTKPRETRSRDLESEASYMAWREDSYQPAKFDLSHSSATVGFFNEPSELYLPSFSKSRKRYDNLYEETGKYDFGTGDSLQRTKKSRTQSKSRKVVVNRATSMTTASSECDTTIPTGTEVDLRTDKNSKQTTKSAKTNKRHGKKEQLAAKSEEVTRMEASKEVKQEQKPEVKLDNSGMNRKSCPPAIGTQKAPMNLHDFKLFLELKKRNEQLESFLKGTKGVIDGQTKENILEQLAMILGAPRLPMNMEEKPETMDYNSRQPLPQAPPLHEMPPPPPNHNVPAGYGMAYPPAPPPPPPVNPLYQMGPGYAPQPAQEMQPQMPQYYYPPPYQPYAQAVGSREYAPPQPMAPLQTGFPGPGEYPMMQTQRMMQPIPTMVNPQAVYAPYYGMDHQQYGSQQLPQQQAPPVPQSQPSYPPPPTDFVQQQRIDNMNEAPQTLNSRPLTRDANLQTARTMLQTSPGVQYQAEEVPASYPHLSKMSKKETADNGQWRRNRQRLASDYRISGNLNHQDHWNHHPTTPTKPPKSNKITRVTATQVTPSSRPSSTSIRTAYDYDYGGSMFTPSYGDLPPAPTPTMILKPPSQTSESDVDTRTLVVFGEEYSRINETRRRREQEGRRHRQDGVIYEYDVFLENAMCQPYEMQSESPRRHKRQNPHRAVASTCVSKSSPSKSVSPRKGKMTTKKTGKKNSTYPASSRTVDVCGEPTCWCDMDGRGCQLLVRRLSHEDYMQAHGDYHCTQKFKFPETATRRKMHRIPPHFKETHSEEMPTAEYHNKAHRDHWTTSTEYYESNETSFQKDDSKESICLPLSRRISQQDVRSGEKTQRSFLDCRSVYNIPAKCNRSGAATTSFHTNPVVSRHRRKERHHSESTSSVTVIHAPNQRKIDPLIAAQFKDLSTAAESSESKCDPEIAAAMQESKLYPKPRAKRMNAITADLKRAREQAIRYGLDKKTSSVHQNIEMESFLERPETGIDNPVSSHDENVVSNKTRTTYVMAKPKVAENIDVSSRATLENACEDQSKDETKVSVSGNLTSVEDGREDYSYNSEQDTSYLEKNDEVTTEVKTKSRTKADRHQSFRTYTIPRTKLSERTPSLTDVITAFQEESEAPDEEEMKRELIRSLYFALKPKKKVSKVVESKPKIPSEQNVETKKENVEEKLPQRDSTAEVREAMEVALKALRGDESGKITLKSSFTYDGKSMAKAFDIATSKTRTSAPTSAAVDSCTEQSTEKEDADADFGRPSYSETSLSLTSPSMDVETDASYVQQEFSRLKSFTSKLSSSPSKPQITPRESSSSYSETDSFKQRQKELQLRKKQALGCGDESNNRSNSKGDQVTSDYEITPDVALMVNDILCRTQFAKRDGGDSTR